MGVVLIICVYCLLELFCVCHEQKRLFYTSKLVLEMLVAGAEKGVVCIDAMFNFTGSSCDFGIVSLRAWRPRTGVSL